MYSDRIGEVYVEIVYRHTLTTKAYTHKRTQWAACVVPRPIGITTIMCHHRSTRTRNFNRGEPITVSLCRDVMM